MFDAYGIRFAREVCIEIARDRVAHLRGDTKARALGYVSLVLRRWQAERAAPDGIVEIDEPWTGLLAPMPSGKKKRVPVSSLQPWQCAGFGITCDADLFARLAYGEGDTHAEAAERKLGSGVPIALLLERDGMSMSLIALAGAVRHLWIYVFETLKVYGDELRTHGRREAKTTADRLNASALGVARKRNRATAKKAEWRAIAAQLWRECPGLKVPAVAGMVIDELRRREHAETDLPKLRTVHDALKGYKPAALADLTRANARKPA